MLDNHIANGHHANGRLPASEPIGQAMITSAIAPLVEQLTRIADLLTRHLPYIEYLENLPENAEAKLAREQQEFSSLPRYARCAYWSYEYACIQRRKQLSDKDAYDWLERKGIPDEPQFEELIGYKPPTFETWSRQLREARQAIGEQKNTPRAGRNPGKSVVSLQHIKDSKKADREPWPLREDD